MLAERSTKAGASTPATLTEQSRSFLRRSSLNEGRSVNPGDTRRGGGIRCHQPRSTKAGASTPATRVGRRHPGHPGRRSTKAGASTPATPPYRTGRVRLRQSTLNEGRSVNPGDTVGTLGSLGDPSGAQRRPERQPRRHPRRRRDGRVRVDRSTKAGASTPATLPCIALVAAQPPRSTKAGASTPATLVRDRAWCPDLLDALNEGRSVNPGDTRHPAVARRG